MVYNRAGNHFQDDTSFHTPRSLSGLLLPFSNSNKAVASNLLVWSQMAKPISSATTSLFQTLKRYLKKPWEITGPCASPEYKSALPMATEYRPECPATTKVKPVVPTSNPETVYDIKYFVRDQRRDRPPIQRTVLKKSDVVNLMKEKQSFDVTEFPIPYLTAKVEEDDNAYGGGYETGFK